MPQITPKRLGPRPCEPHSRPRPPATLYHTHRRRGVEGWLGRQNEKRSQGLQSRRLTSNAGVCWAVAVATKAAIPTNDRMMRKLVNLENCVHFSLWRKQVSLFVETHSARWLWDFKIQYKKGEFESWLAPSPPAHQPAN